LLYYFFFQWDYYGAALPSGAVVIASRPTSIDQDSCQGANTATFSPNVLLVSLCAAVGLSAEAEYGGRNKKK
jgi:hypothetical protein